MKKLTILVDIDSIVANLTDPWFAAYNKDYDDDLHMSRVDIWHTHQLAKPECGKKIYDYLTPELISSLEPLDGSVRHVNKLRDDGHQVVFVTAVAKAEQNSNARVQWIQKYFPWATTKDVIITSAKYLIKGDVLIDDAPHNLAAYHEAWPNAMLLRIGYPYNTGAPGMCYGSHEDPELAWVMFYHDISKLAWLLAA